MTTKAKLTFVCTLSLSVCLATGAEDKPSTYHNPIDKKDYRAKWHTYTSETPGTPAPEGKVKMGDIRLLTEQPIFDRNTTAEKLVTLIKGTHDRISKAVPPTAPGFKLLVQITLTPRNRPKFEMLPKGEPPQKQLLESISESLKKAPDLRSKTDSLLLQIDFTVSGANR